MARRFGKISANLDTSKRFNALPDDGCKLAYTWLLWCRYGNGIGLFQLPPMFLAVSLCQGDLDDAERRLDALERARLIERAPEDVVRVCQWFSKENSPRNPSIAMAILKHFQDRSQIGDSQARTSAFLEFAFQVFCKVPSWEDSRVFSALLAELPKEIEREYTRVPQLCEQALLSLGYDKKNIAWRTVWDMMPASCEQEREKNENQNESGEHRTQNIEPRAQNVEHRARAENGEPRADPGAILDHLNKAAKGAKI